MRKYLVLCCCIALTISLFWSQPSEGYNPVAPSAKVFAENPMIKVQDLELTDLNTSDIGVTRYIKNGFQVLGTFRVWVRFVYDYQGYVSAYQYQAGDYHSSYGWTLYENGVSCRDGTVTFHMELRKGLTRIPCTLTVCCDEEGNVYSQS